MKKSKSIRCCLVLFIAVMMTMSLVSGTMAKYVQATKGNDTARVAQFELEVQSFDDRNGNDDLTRWTATGTQINLFSTTTNNPGIFDQSLTAYDSNNGVKLIAPGTSGGFHINVKNFSEVAVKTVYTYYDLNYSSYGAANSTVGGKLITGGMNELGQAITSQIGNLGPTNGVDAFSIPLQRITWAWAYESNDMQTDEKDTALAVDSNPLAIMQPTVTLNLTCIAEQILDYVA
jgi:hypothetical protein